MQDQPLVRHFDDSSGLKGSPSATCARWACAVSWSIAPTTVEAMALLSAPIVGRTRCGYRTSSRGLSAGSAEGAAQTSGPTSTGTSRQPLRWVIDEEKVPPPGQWAEQTK